MTHTISFLLGVLATVFAVLIMLSMIEIPEYTVIYQLETPSCDKTLRI